MPNLLLLFLLLLTPTLCPAQNSPYLWKNDCPCGAAQLVRIDAATDETFVVTAFAPGTRLLKLDDQGNTVWNVPVTLPGAAYTNVYNMVIDKAGQRIFVAGAVNAPLPSGEWPFVAEISAADGSVLDFAVADTVPAATLHGGTAGASGYHFAFERAANGSLYLAALDPATFQVLFLKFNAALELVGTFRSPSATSSPDRARVLLTQTGGMYYYVETPTEIIGKVNAALNGTAWELVAPDLHGLSMFAATGTDGLLYAVHRAEGFAPARVTRINDLGNAVDLNWTVQFSTIDLRHIVADSAGAAVYAVGYWQPLTPITSLVAAVRLDGSTGQVVWQTVDSLSNARPEQIALDRLGRLVAVGGGGPYPGSDYTTLLFGAGGALEQSLVYDGACGEGKSNDGAAGVAFNSQNHIVVTGSACEDPSTTTNGAVTLAYAPLPAVSVVDPPNAVGVRVFPNPAVHRLAISVTPPRTLERVELRAIDGRLVRAVAFAGVREATIAVADLPAGVYVAGLMLDGGIFTERISIGR